MVRQHAGAETAGAVGVHGLRAGRGAILWRDHDQARRERKTSSDRDTLHAAKTGETITRQGKALVYTGFQWRGRSQEGTAEKDPWREVMFVDGASGELTGRWFKAATTRPASTSL